MKMIKYPSIEQFRNVIHDVKHSAQYQGMDEDGNPIMDINAKMPKITFNGTVKLHGSNGGVSYQNRNLVTLSRKNIITPQKDNAGFANFVDKNKEIIKDFMIGISTQYKVHTDKNYISIYGEWAGQGIQKGVGISLIPKSWFIFGVKITPLDEDLPAYWVDIDFVIDGKLFLEYTPARIYNIKNFKQFTVTVDFEKPELSQNTFVELVNEVEDRCPVASTFLPDNPELVGEGIVWTGKYKDNEYRFKTKGEKHSKSKVKVVRELSPEDLAKLSKVEQCVEQIFSAQRANQALTEIFGPNFEEDIDVKKLGEYLKWVSTDTIKEELDIIQSYDLEPKDVMKKVQELYKKYFFGVLKA